VGSARPIPATRRSRGSALPTADSARRNRGHTAADAAVSLPRRNDRRCRWRRTHSPEGGRVRLDATNLRSRSYEGGAAPHQRCRGRLRAGARRPLLQRNRPLDATRRSCRIDDAGCDLRVPPPRGVTVPVQATGVAVSARRANAEPAPQRTRAPPPPKGRSMRTAVEGLSQRRSAAQPTPCRRRAAESKLSALRLLRRDAAPRASSQRCAPQGLPAVRCIRRRADQTVRSARAADTVSRSAGRRPSEEDRRVGPKPGVARGAETRPVRASCGDVRSHDQHPEGLCSAMDALMSFRSPSAL
jgi:hypothetical protein